VRVLFSLLDAGVGGGQRVAIDVARRLIAEGDTVGVLVPADGPAGHSFRELGGVVQLADLQTLRRPKGISPAAALARGFDLLYSHTSVPGEILGARVARRAGSAHVVHRHTDPYFSPRTFPRLIQRPLYRRGVRSTSFVAVAPHIAASLERLGVERGRITVIPNGVDVEAVREHARDTEVRTAEPLVGILGRLDPTQKGQDVFIEAVRRMKEPRASFVIGGASGPFREQEAAVRRAAADVGVPIEDPGSAGIEFLASLDVVVMPSNYEGSPLTLFEAMALGKPIIASRIPGIMEVLEPADAGVLVRPDDAESLAGAITSLVAEPARREALGRTALEVVRREHDLAHVLDRIVGVLRLAFAERRGQGEASPA
jgi:glycosyltransferase involved in cell wall biosynthesis